MLQLEDEGCSPTNSQKAKTGSPKKSVQFWAFEFHVSVQVAPARICLPKWVSTHTQMPRTKMAVSSSMLSGLCLSPVAMGHKRGARCFSPSQKAKKNKQKQNALPSANQGIRVPLSDSGRLPEVTESLALRCVRSPRGVGPLTEAAKCEIRGSKRFPGLKYPLLQVVPSFAGSTLFCRWF